MELASTALALLDIARAAGNRILEIYDSDFEVETKADQSPLTAADQASHRLILDSLRALTPDIPVWSEESADIEYSRRKNWDRFWLVDPLDGTKEFIKRNGEFTVNIALIEAHEPILGIVHVPVKGQDYVGYRGGGSSLIENGGKSLPIRVSEPGHSPVRVVGSRSHRGASLESFLGAIGEHVMVPMGSSLKICLVAAGLADVYPRLGPTSEWDTAAAQAVLENAGGLLVDLSGKQLRYNTSPEVLNPFFVACGADCGRWVNILQDLA